ncbi:MAG: sce7726 family protein, partial [Rhodospirillaceae bacterium]
MSTQLPPPKRTTSMNITSSGHLLCDSYLTTIGIPTGLSGVGGIGMGIQEFDPFGVGPAADFKRAFLRYLIGSRHWRSDPVSASEMVVESWRGRVDMALFNGHLHAFEIKSDADRLDRLPDQIRRMMRHFDSVGVVCGDRHLDKVGAVVEAIGEGRVGVYLVAADGTVRQKRPSRIVAVKEPLALVSFLVRDDIEVAFERDRVPYRKDEYAYILRQQATDIRPSILRSVAMASLKARFRSRGERLIAALDQPL